MSDKLEQWRDYARIALAGIRLFNGAAALFAPEWLVGRLGGQHIQSCFLYAKHCGKRTRPKFCTLS
ncbi:MAG TPA: hypothetical protein VFA10_10020 [Ktedonobacteraceae bacterium]|nr:hypothetical protein [Ktedonobacteraceae bacterium]